MSDHESSLPEAEGRKIISFMKVEDEYGICDCVEIKLDNGVSYTFSAAACGYENSHVIITRTTRRFEMSEQKPMSMDTAPKDGTHILGYGVHYSYSGDYNPVTGWAECELCQDDWWINTIGDQSNLTAWLPLPPTPTEG